MAFPIPPWPTEEYFKTLLDKRIRNGNVEYLVEWEGSDECSWEPKTNLNFPKLPKFEEDLKEEQRKAKEQAPVRGFDRGLQVWPLTQFFSVSFFLFV